MIIGKIDYINLLPFYIFLRRHLKTNERAALEFHKGPPKKINQLLAKRRVEAAVISSIHSPKYHCSDFGIVANKRVLSVLICPGEHQEDSESDTSNVLAKILQVHGKIVIGDKALRLRNAQNCQDLAALWYKKFQLPFVFARFCYHTKTKKYQQLADKFLKNTHIKIPYYILRQYAQRSNLTQKEMKAYLALIQYRLGYKEKKALKKFLFLAKHIPRK